MQKQLGVLAGEKEETGWKEGLLEDEGQAARNVEAGGC